MKKKVLNNKGLTIIELIISVALISVVMLFMYKLLSDVSFEKDNDFFASLNQSQRIEIIDAIESAVMKNTKSYSRSGNYSITFTNGTVSSTLSINSLNKKTITFTSGTNNSIWNMNAGEILGIITCNEAASNEYIVVECKIPIYTTNTSDNQDNNNTIDDIAFSFIISKQV